MIQEKYRDRQDAGRQLAKLLQYYSTSSNLILLALPRGGIPVAYEIAQVLHVPLYPYVVRKLGVPGYAELAMGAIATGGTIFFNQSVISEMNVAQNELQAVIQSEKMELERREKVYLSGKTLPSLENKTIILVDDGIATGATIKVAIAALRASKPTAIVVAVPVCPESIVKDMKELADEFICPSCISNFDAVGKWYDAFPAVEDNEVKSMLDR